METKITMVKETRLVPKETYIANDGTEFLTRGECITYEEELLEKKIDTIKTCKSLDGYTPFDGGEYMEDHDYRWFFPANDNEIKLLNERYPDLELLPCAINKWVCVEYIGDSVYYSYLDDSVGYAKKLLRKLGYKMTVEKVGEADV